MSIAAAASNVSETSLGTMNTSLSFSGTIVIGARSRTFGRRDRHLMGEEASTMSERMTASHDWVIDTVLSCYLLSAGIRWLHASGATVLGSVG
jgi:hypothetical protein